MAERGTTELSDTICYVAQSKVHINFLRGLLLHATILCKKPLHVLELCVVVVLLLFPLVGTSCSFAPILPLQGRLIRILQLNLRIL